MKTSDYASRRRGGVLQDAMGLLALATLLTVSWRRVSDTHDRLQGGRELARQGVGSTVDLTPPF